jgi:hypothetical protein
MERLLGEGCSTSAVTLTGSGRFRFLDDLNMVEHDLHPSTVSISTVHHALNLIATLLAGFSIAGLLFVVLFLFQSERSAATAQSRRRDK